MYIQTYLNTLTQRARHTNTFTYNKTNTRTDILTCRHIQVYTHLHTGTNTPQHTQSYTQTYTHTNKKDTKKRIHTLITNTGIHISAEIHVHI